MQFNGYVKGLRERRDVTADFAARHRIFRDETALSGYRGAADARPGLKGVKRAGLPRQRTVRVALAQGQLGHFACGGHRQVFHEDHLVRHLPFGEVFGQVVLKRRHIF